MKTQQGRQYFTPFSSISIVDWEQGNAGWEDLLKVFMTFSEALKNMEISKFVPNKASKTLKASNGPGFDIISVSIVRYSPKICSC